MATIVVMPALGNSVESCLITSWIAKEGDEVKVDDTLCEVETDKASMEVPSTAAGTILKILWQEGDDVPVKQPLLVVGDAGEDPQPALDDAGWGGEDADDAPEDKGAEPEQADDKPEAPTAKSDSQPTTPASGTSPRARALAESEHVDINAISEGSGPGGRVIERDVRAAIDSGAATAAAARAGAVGSGVEGTGLGGRISTADLGRDATQPTEPRAAATAAALAPDEVTETPLKGVRKVIAERMMNSLASSAQLSYHSSANAEGLLAMRKKLKNSDAALGYSGITIGDLVGFAAVRTLLRHPAHNAHLVDGVLKSFGTVHMGFACDTPRGLLVPVVKGASRMSLREFSDRSKELAHQAIDGNINPYDLSGGTFTVSNLGSFGIEAFTPILNAPETAILGVSAITPRAKLLDDGTVGVEQRMHFSLTADHRAIDGADAARFLADLVKAVENIELTILG